MTENMIAKVQHALDGEAHSIEPDARISDLTAEEWEKLARAAIEAMREPTEGVWRSIDKAIHKDWPNAKKMAIGVHQAFIDAALSEKP